MVSSFDRLYYEDSYCSHFRATVIRCEASGGHFLVELDQTAFYPEGGGQPADTGFLGDVRVLDVHEQDGRILHTTDQPLAEGAEVDGSIDWERRFAFMQQHSGEHILSGILHDLKGCDNVGFHIGSTDTTIDFNMPLSEDELAEAERLANQAVFDNRPVVVSYPSSDSRGQMEYRSKIELGGDVRLVTVPGSDVCACCGLHVQCTGEIGLIKIVSSQKYKGGTRLSIVCGTRALDDYALKNRQASALSSLLSAKSTELVEGVQRLQAEAAALKAKAGRLARTLADCRAQVLAVQPGPLCLFEADATPEDLRTLCLRLIEDRDEPVGIFSPAEEGLALESAESRRWRYAVGSRQTDMRLFSKAMNAALNGTGGGNPRVAQGTLTATRADIEAWFREAPFA